VCKVDAKSALRNQIREAQRYDHQLQESKEWEVFSVASEGMILFKGRVCVPNNVGIKRMVLEENHSSYDPMHPGATKMY
jgi:hypothetical protein